MASIRKRTWGRGRAQRTAWVVDYRYNGQRRFKTFARKKDADHWWSHTLPEITAGAHVPDGDSLTVERAAETWIAACERGRDGGHPVEPHTLRTYKQHAAVISEMAGWERLNAFNKARIEKFRDDLLERKSRATARKILTSFKSILAEGGAGPAVYQAARQVRIRPDDGRHERKISVPEPSQMRAVLAKADELAGQRNKQRAKCWGRWRAVVYTAALTGLRQSELRGLAWSRVDLGSRLIRVRERADERGMIGKVKSKAAIRDIPIPAALAALLREWKIACPPNDLGLAFPNWRGNVETGSNVYRRGWRDLLDKAGMPPFKFHALRHFHASQLIADGANPKEVQAEMGHRSIKTTYDLYGHLFEEDATGRRARADRLAAALA